MRLPYLKQTASRSFSLLHPSASLPQWHPWIFLQLIDRAILFNQRVSRIRESSNFTLPSIDYPANHNPAKNSPGALSHNPTDTTRNEAWGSLLDDLGSQVWSLDQGCVKTLRDVRNLLLVDLLFSLCCFISFELL